MESKILKGNIIPLGQKGREKEDAKVRAKLKGSGSAKRVFSQRVRRAKENPKKNK